MRAGSDRADGHAAKAAMSRQRPAEPRGGEAERGRRGHDQHLLRVDMARQQRADAVEERIARGEHADLPAALRDHLAHRLVERARPRPHRAADKRAASSRWRLPPNTISASAISPRATGAEALDAVLADADDGQPAARCGSVSGERASERHAAYSHPRRHERGAATGRAPRGPTDLKVTLSLAGRTARPAAQPVPVRVGGFGGAEGLAAYLAAQRIDVLIDATHPYAATISAHAAEAAARASVPIVALRRPAWTAVAGDRWTEVEGCRCRNRRVGRRAAPRVPRYRPPGGRRLRRRSAARLSHPQRRSGRAAAQRAARDIYRGARPVQRGRRTRAAEAAPHRNRRRQEQRRAGDLRQDRRGAGAGHRRHHAAPAEPCPRCLRSKRCRMRVDWLDHALVSGAERGV